MGQGLDFLDKARDEYGDPSIQAGRSVHGRSISTKRPAIERFRASAEFLNRSGQTQTLDTTPINTGSPAVRATNGGLPVTNEMAFSRNRSYLTPIFKDGVQIGARRTGSGSRGLTPIFKDGVQIGLRGSPPKKTGLPVQSRNTKPQRPVFASGLPTSGMPTFAQLGGELGRISKFIGDTSKFNASRGLPTKSKKKIDKTKITALTKLHESALLTNPERAKQLEDLIGAELGLDFGVEEDLSAIENR